MIAALIVVPLALPGDGRADSAPERCSAIRDSAICAGRSDCYYDVNGRGCLQGARPYEDACAAHSDKAVCDTDISLGCKWDGAKNACASKVP
jgi:hypothetical protein